MNINFHIFVGRNHDIFNSEVNNDLTMAFFFTSNHVVIYELRTSWLCLTWIQSIRFTSTSKTVSTHTHRGHGGMIKIIQHQTEHNRIIHIARSDIIRHKIRYGILLSESHNPANTHNSSKQLAIVSIPLLLKTPLPTRPPTCD